MANLKLKFEHSDLASRDSAAEFRQTVLDCLNERGAVELDLGDVLCMSDAFADELFGGLAVTIGLEGLLASVKVLNAKDGVYKTIAMNIHNRLCSAKPS